MSRCLPPWASAEFSLGPSRSLTYHTASYHSRTLWRPCDHEDARTWNGWKNWKCLVWCRVQHLSLLMNDDVSPQYDRWYNGTTQHLHGSQSSFTSDKMPRLGYSFVLHQYSVPYYTSKGTCSGILQKKMHNTQSLLTSILMPSCMKAILTTRGLKMTAAVSFYQRTAHVCFLHFFVR